MSIKTLRLTHSAQNDLDEIRSYSEKNFGIKTANEYELLIAQAFKDLKNNPSRLGSKSCDNVYEGMHSYHIRHSKSNIALPIKSPRHIVFYILPQKEELVVARVLHDSRDPNLNMKELHD